MDVPGGSHTTLHSVRTMLFPSIVAHSSNGSRHTCTLSFQDGAENLDWASMMIEVVVDEQSYTCSFGSQSVAVDEDAKVNSRLSSDG